MKLGYGVAVVLAACGGMVDPDSVGDRSSASRAGAGEADQGAGATAPPLPNGIPLGPGVVTGARGSMPCQPLEPVSAEAATLTTPVIFGRSANYTVYLIDSDPERPGRHRAFVGHRSVLERHAISEDSATPGRFIIDRGMPHQVAITSSSVEGAGLDGPLLPVEDDVKALYRTASNASPHALSFAPSPADLYQGKMLFVVGPASGGVLGVPRVFYGSSEAIEERTFLGFTPADSYDTARPATSVTFDLDGSRVTLPTIVRLETQGLINGFGSSALNFRCF